MEKIAASVVIIGGSVDNDIDEYVATSHFERERQVIDACKSFDMPFVYFAHPKLGNAAARAHNLGKGQYRIGIKNVFLTDCKVVGGFSTALFEHDSSNQVYLFDEATHILGDEFVTCLEDYEIVTAAEFVNIIRKALKHEQDA